MIDWMVVLSISISLSRDGIVDVDGGSGWWWDGWRSGSGEMIVRVSWFHLARITTRRLY